MTKPQALDQTTVPVMPRGIRLHWDDVRQRWCLLAPERVIALDTIAAAILRHCNGQNSVIAIIGVLVEQFSAPADRIEADVLPMLDVLFLKRFLVDHRTARHHPPQPEMPQPANRPEAQSTDIPLPLAALAELTHRCPLQCPYCSNPLALERAQTELSSVEWKRLIDEMAALGVLQIHFSGGEPMARKDLAELVRHAHNAGLYTNLITSGVLLDKKKIIVLADAGLDHVQISFQDADKKQADRLAGLDGAFAKKQDAARLVRQMGLPLTFNAVMHRQNLHRLPGLIEMAAALDASRMEVAHVQYMGWALHNRAALMPTIAQFAEASEIVEAARERLKGRLVIDHVMPDYYAVRPKKCMGGWAEQFFNITPSGKVLPCHAAQTIPGLEFSSVRDHDLAWIWRHSPAINAFRGTGWMKDPCQNCEFREQDHGGCRCQALALTGDAANTDPTCSLSPLHDNITRLAETESLNGDDDFRYRNFHGPNRAEGSPIQRR